ncbi:RNA binding motif protein 12Bb [Aulostomus maculatus]
MAVVIRLQGLRITAGSQDIRKFFTGLKIPDGGVHIIGGEREEAFIIFASDEDARRAMTRSGGIIQGSSVTLLLSSKAEMQNMLEKTSKTFEQDQQRLLDENARHSRRSEEPETRMTTTGNFVFLKGLPFSVTQKEIYNFFSGLLMDDVILLKNERGKNNGTGIVKFARREDAMESLKRDREYIGSRYVELFPTTEDYWLKAVARAPVDDNADNRFDSRGSPFHNRRDSPLHARSKSPTAQRPTASSCEEFCILLENLSYAVEKQDLKRLFRSISLEDDQILYLNGDDRTKTRSAFVLLNTLRDYRVATAHEKRPFFNRWVYVRPVSREKMITLLEAESMNPTGNTGRFQESPPSYPRDRYDSEKVCMYVQNLPFDVRKVEIMDFFLGFSITEDDVFLLRNNAGAGIGKALVLFRSETAAMSALSLSGQRFLGSEVALKCISRSQMQELGVEPPLVQGKLQKYDHFSSGSSEGSFWTGDTECRNFRGPCGEGSMSMTNLQGPICGGGNFAGNCHGPKGSGNGVRGSCGQSVQPFDGPTCVKLANLPFQLKSQEIYDFCYGYNIMPGSVSLQYDQSGAPKGTATVVFESRQEALTAIEELSGRPIGPRKIQLMIV